MFYTVYKITNNISGRAYIGMHKTDDINDGYMGSGTILKRHQRKYGMEIFEKEILHVYDTREEMVAKETELVNEEWVKDPTTYNLTTGGGGGDHTTGMVSVRDEDGNTFSVKKDDPRYISGELVGATKGFVNVKDKSGKTFQVDKNDERFLSGELVGHSKGIRKSDKMIEDCKRAQTSRHSELTENRLADYHAIEKKRGYIAKLARKWEVSHSMVIKFEKQHIE